MALVIMVKEGYCSIFLFCKNLQTKWTPLHLVVMEREGDMELTNMLLEHGAETNLDDSVCY